MSLYQTNVTFNDKKIPLQGKVEFFSTGRYHLFIKTNENLFIFGNNLHNQLGVSSFEIESAQKELESIRERHIKKKNSNEFLKPTFLEDPVEKRKELESLEAYFNASFREEDDFDISTSDSSDSLLESPLTIDMEDESLLSPDSQFHYKALTEWSGPIDHESITNIVCGGFHSVFIIDDGAKLYVSGNNIHYQCGLEHCEPLGGLVRIQGISLPVKHVACGEFHTIFCTYTNEIAICGVSGLENLPDSKRLTFINYPWLKGKSIKQLSAGGGFSFILCDDGDLYGFGRSNKGQLGVYKSRISVPTKIDLGDNWIPQSIACGFSYSVILAKNNSNSDQILFGGGVFEFNIQEINNCSFVENTIIQTPNVLRYLEKNAENPTEFFEDSPITPKHELKLEYNSPIGKLSPITRNYQYPQNETINESLVSIDLDNIIMKELLLNNCFQEIHLRLENNEKIINIISGEIVFIVETNQRLIPIGNEFQQNNLKNNFHTRGIPLPVNKIIKQYGAMDNSILRIIDEKDFHVPTYINQFRLDNPNFWDLRIEFSCFDLEIKKFSKTDITKLPKTSIIPSLLSPTTEKMIKESKKIAKKSKKSKKIAKKISKKSKK